MFDFMIALSRPVVNVQRATSSPTTFMSWYLASMNMLKGTISVLLDSTIR